MVVPVGATPVHTVPPASVPLPPVPVLPPPPPPPLPPLPALPPLPPLPPSEDVLPLLLHATARRPSDKNPILVPMALIFFISYLQVSRGFGTASACGGRNTSANRHPGASGRLRAVSVDVGPRHWRGSGLAPGERGAQARGSALDGRGEWGRQAMATGERGDPQRLGDCLGGRGLPGRGRRRTSRGAEPLAAAVVEQ